MRNSQTEGFCTITMRERTGDKEKKNYDVILCNEMDVP